MLMEEVVLKELVEERLKEKSEYIVEQIDKQLDAINERRKAGNETDGSDSELRRNYKILIELKFDSKNIDKLRKIKEEVFEKFNIRIVKFGGK